MTHLTTFKACGYTTLQKDSLQKDSLQKLRRISTATADQTCAYWREC